MTRLAALQERVGAERIWGDGSVDVQGVRHDSRTIEAGDLFVAIPGATTDGTRYVSQAIKRGAIAVASQTKLPVGVPQLIVGDPRRSLGLLAAAVYGDPTRALSVVGITGTNGKTTTTWILDRALQALGASPALLGTIESRGPGVREPAPFTTPEGDAIARFARGAVDGGASHLVMEVSSHALAQYRADGVCFRVAGFTNLTQDHLDFHGTMAAYLEAKARLFDELSPQSAVINVDDAHGSELARRYSGPRLLRVSREREAEVRVIRFDLGRGGIRAELEVQGCAVSVDSPMIGLHNLDNLALALGCLVALDYSPERAAEAVSSCRGVPGRLELVEGLPGVQVLVDYAHTPDALAHALDTISAITPGRRIVVFGCGGDRDQDKRPKMGAAAGARSDLAIVTSDNPRTEDPFLILRAIEPSVAQHLPLADVRKAARGYQVVEDREAAIQLAISIAQPGDTVLIAGKGHEDYQVRGTQKVRFDDREQARTAILARGEAG